MHMMDRWLPLLGIVILGTFLLATGSELRRERRDIIEGKYRQLVGMMAYAITVIGLSYAFPKMNSGELFWAMFQICGLALVAGGIGMYYQYRHDAYCSYRVSAWQTLVALSISGLVLVFGTPFVFR